MGTTESVVYSTRERFVKPSANIHKLFSTRVLRFLTGVVLLLFACDPRIFSQEPLRAPRPLSELSVRDAARPAEEEPEQSFEPVDPDSAGIPQSWFSKVQLHPTALAIQPAEVPAYFRILEHVQTVPPDNLAKAGREFRLEMIEKFGERTREKIQREVKDPAQQKRVLAELEERLKKYREEPFTYPLVRDAFNQAEECQGRVVSFSGHVRRVVSLPAGENDHGFEQLYEIWLFDEDANQYPVIIVCSEIPEGLPVNFPDTEVVDGVSVRGYFFKLYAYQGEEKPHAIPMILARTVEWNPPETVSMTIPGWAYGVAIALGIIALWLIIRSNRPDKRLRSVRERMNEPEDNPFRQPE